MDEKQEEVLSAFLDTFRLMGVPETSEDNTISIEALKKALDKMKIYGESDLRKYNAMSHLPMYRGLRDFPSCKVTAYDAPMHAVLPIHASCPETLGRGIRISGDVHGNPTHYERTRTTNLCREVSWSALDDSIHWEAKDIYNCHGIQIISDHCVDINEAIIKSMGLNESVIVKMMNEKSEEMHSPHMTKKLFDTMLYQMRMDNLDHLPKHEAEAIILAEDNKKAIMDKVMNTHDLQEAVNYANRGMGTTHFEIKAGEWDNMENKMYMTAPELLHPRNKPLSFSPKEKYKNKGRFR